MTAYTKWMGCWIGFFVSAAIAGLLIVNVSNLFIIAFFANLLLWSHLIRQIACEQCGAAVYQTVDDFHERPRAIRVPVSVFKRTCHVCGCDLRKHAS